jgi:anti-anti-sigma regulatory factor
VPDPDSNSWSPPSVEIALSPPDPESCAALVTLRGEHDLASRDSVEAALAPILGDVVIDLSTCEFLDLTVSRVLRTKATELVREGHRLDIRGTPQRIAVARLIDLGCLATGLAPDHGHA